jgi:hypothetical protein
LTGEGYVRKTSEWPSNFTDTIIDRRTDNEGNIWYKILGEGSFWKLYELWKINNSKTIWKLMWSTADYPNAINTESGYYLIFYRQ